ncbi:MAG: tRNA (adenosine(37)-N6)-threonylcarbamoyltransferase complex transferase subunit TsaD [Proteobacteria bacterium]|nr:tRNA (adenosine(37)-N6)-threonylcarbamoyltransferase complex transferase subunit TsaD [Pseudomonadota bacterium]
MITLGIESSCDETSCGILKDGDNVLSNIILTQEIHSEFGGVVPEIASREHNKFIYEILEKALNKAKVEMDDIDLIGVTNGPGLMGALMVGIAFAKGLGFSYKKPVIAVNHIEGHILANFIEFDIKLPAIVMMVSGGHTELILMKDFGKYHVLGRTIDDAAGEAFDKVARILGLRYPGGPEIEKLAKKGDENYLKLPIAVKKELNFSFSGIKTAVMYYYRELSEADKGLHRADIAASIEKAIADNLLYKVEKAVDMNKPESLIISGGVAANNYIRKKFEEFSSEKGIKFYAPPLKLCTDNGIMVAKAAYENHIRGTATHNLNPVPNLKLIEV